MKSIAQQLQEKSTVLRARGKGDVVDAILQETSEFTIEHQLGKLDEFQRSLSPVKVSLKHNGASDNRVVESFQESGEEKTARESLIEAAYAAFPDLFKTKEDAAGFADPDCNQAGQDMVDAVLHPEKFDRRR